MTPLGDVNALTHNRNRVSERATDHVVFRTRFRRKQGRRDAEPPYNASVAQRSSDASANEILREERGK